MTDQVQRIAELIIRQLNEDLSESELNELQNWMNLSERNRLIANEFLNEETLRAGIAEIYSVENSVWQKLQQHLNETSARKNESLPIFYGRNYARLIKRMAIAASIIVAVSLGSYWIFFNNPGSNAKTVHTTTPANDIKSPEINRATITLADGETIYLDSVNNGTLASQSGVSVIKTADGQIVYDGMSKGVLVINTLSNPRGSRVLDMTLSDGSRVWLNAGSSVTFPVAFIGNERKVEVKGEAYFEVAPNASKPFKVTKGNLEVAVLGTHFNVNAYDDENEIKVTLLEGSVKVSSTNSQYPNSKFLVPGQQAILNLGNQSTIQLINPDLESVMAWKNGEFQFGDKADINTIMRQLSRWYNVEVEYKGTIKGHIGGSISRNVHLSKVLEMLERTGLVKFRMEENKVIVMP